MFVKNVIKDERQHEYSMPITSRVGIIFPMIDTIGITEWSCVGNVITHFIESTNLKP